MKSIGIVEVVGMISAIEALDAMTKASNVTFKTMEGKLGGRLVTIVVEGDIDDVLTAIDIGEKTANSITKCVARAAIARPHQEVLGWLNKSSLKYEKA